MGSGTYNAAVWGGDLGQCMGLYVKGNMLNTYELVMILRWHYICHYGFDYFGNEYITHSACMTCSNTHR